MSLKDAKKLTIEGLLLGITTGLVVTLFDGLFIIIPRLYVPYSYPLLLITFNTIFWMSIGGLSGFSLWFFTSRKGNLQRKRNFFWVLFFILPFAMIYGLLGRFYIPLSIWEAARVNPVFDNHLSFAWVGLILLFLFLYLGKRGNEKEFPSFLLTFEIIIFIVLFQLCSNLSRTGIIKLHTKYYTLFQTVQLEQVTFLKAVYALGVLSILGFYFITFFKIRPFIKENYIIRNSYRIGILFLVVSACLTGFFALSHKRLINTGIHPIVTTGGQETAKKVTHVILIVLDTVRSDRLSIYGHTATTKNLEALCKDALLFKKCIASSSWTIPSHASLFTGLYPTEHGSHGNLDPQMKDSWGLPLPIPLSEDFMTLAEVFREHDYQTSAIVSNFMLLKPALKLGQGFQSMDYSKNIGALYQEYPFRPILHTFCYLTNLYPKYVLFYRTADDITKESVRLLNNSLSSPIFLFINYFDAHGPYLPPRPFAGYYLNKLFPHFYRLKLWFLGLTGKLDQKSRDFYQLSQYDGEIAFLDNQIGKLFSHLKKIGLYESSLIIITSDHGELFGEHGIYWHKSLMYEGVVRIPLIIKFPFSTRVGHYEEIVTLSDLYPTILSICGLPVPQGISGKSFGNPSSPVASEFYNYGIGKHQILYDGQYKYMKYEYERESELYDLEKDPLERENLISTLPEVASELEAKLIEWEERHKPKYTSSAKTEKALSKGVLEDFSALGYIQ